MVFRYVRLAVAAGASAGLLAALPLDAHAEPGAGAIPLPTLSVAPPVVPTVLPTVPVPTLVPTVAPTVVPTLPVPTVTVPTVPPLPSVTVPPVPSLPVPSLPVPSVSLPPVPSLPVPSLPVPTLSVPSLPIPSVPGLPEIPLPVALPGTLPPLPLNLPVGVPLPPTKGLPPSLEGAVVVAPVPGMAGTALDTNGDGIADAVVAKDGTVRRVGPVAPGTATRVDPRVATRPVAAAPLPAPGEAARDGAVWAAALLVAAVGALQVAATRRGRGTPLP